MLLRLQSLTSGECRIYDLANIPETEAINDFIALTGDKSPDGSYFEFQMVKKHELEWWARVGEEA